MTHAQAQAQTQPLAPLSQNLRQWRQRRGMSVSELARSARVSKSTVSELERGIGNPSLDTLWALARTLNVSLGSFFTHGAAASRGDMLRLADAPVLAHDGETFVAQLLAGWKSQGEVELCVVTLAADARRDSKGNAPGIVERAVCIEGQVEIGTVAGPSFLLRPGDLVTFPADEAHFYQAVAGPARMVVVQQYPSRR